MRSGASRLWIHAALMFGVAIFLFPFLWMVLTSLRTDEELLEPTFLPRVPTFIGRSPYVRPGPPLAKPMEVPLEQWEAALPRLQHLADAAIRASIAKSPPAPAPPAPPAPPASPASFTPPAPSAPAPSSAPSASSPRAVNADALANAATPVVINDLAAKLPTDAWSGPADALAGAFSAMLTPRALAAAVDDRLARLELRGLQLRTIDGHVHQLSGPTEAASRWKVVAGDATLEPHPGARGARGAWLHYTFKNASAEPIVLEHEFDLPTEPENFHKLLVNYKADDSWHRVDATLDLPGRSARSGHWVSTRTTYIAQHRPGSIILQPPSFDDQTFRNKIWVPMRKEGSGFGVQGSGNAGEKNNFASSSPEPRTLNPEPSPRAARLRLIISPSSTPRAIYGKVIRNYERAFYQVPFLLYIVNSLIVVTLTTLGALFSSTFVAYAFARLNWPGRSVALVLLLSTMMLPAQVTLVPQFVVWRQLGWYNTLNPLWVPAWFGSGFFIFLMIQHMKTIPRELEEAARIDGLNAVQTWWYIMVPLVKPAAAAIAILTVMASWNEFLKPLIYLRDQAKFPLSLGLFGLRVDVLNDWTLLMAGNVMMTLPMLVIFFLFQRYFISGMTMSGMKG